MPQEIADIRGYHAHVYYDAESKPAAADLREAIEARFEVRMGRWHDRPVGPHPRWSYQVAFEPPLFAEIVPWLALNRGDLVIFIHPETGDDLPDHRDRALWLGDYLELNLDALR
ncbi:MAG TPA: 4,5-dioxygenase [Kiloniellaceae bacterium]|nr:4,5-dioxygenase [Kiloniellaceae bacterium]HIP77263.1 4,5-dioxygenase [Kiloniellaceae bacterium]